VASRRYEIYIDRDPDDVWNVVSDAERISEWFPLIEKSTVRAGKRRIELRGGGVVEEDIVTNDAALRRFQYRISGGDVPVEFHLGTIDVIPVRSGSLVIYGTDVLPDERADVIGPATQEALANLPHYLANTDPEPQTTSKR